MVFLPLRWLRCLFGPLSHESKGLFAYLNYSNRLWENDTGNKLSFKAIHRGAMHQHRAHGHIRRVHTPLHQPQHQHQQVSKKALQILPYTSIHSKEEDQRTVNKHSHDDNYKPDIRAHAPKPTHPPLPRPPHARLDNAHRHPTEQNRPIRRSQRRPQYGPTSRFPHPRPSDQRVP